ncbi:uncharacterized protein [Palaemon carinicauda]|uniref:uncharacterized protein n=1 Tax=Palaemon carinicauda TaxID=392227 RepID=UPI0035B67577
MMRNHIHLSLSLVMLLWTPGGQALPPLGCHEKVTLFRVGGVLSALLVITSIIIAIQFKRRQHKQEDLPDIPNQPVKHFTPDVTLEPPGHKQQHLASDIRIPQDNSECIYEEISPGNRHPLQGYSRASGFELETYTTPKNYTVFHSTVNDIYESLESFETISDIGESTDVSQ